MPFLVNENPDAGGLLVRTATFLIRLSGYFMFTIITLWIGLLPLLLMLYYTIFINPNKLVGILLLPVTALGTWIVGFFVFTILHSNFAVRLWLPSLQEGTFPHKSKDTILMALRLAADGIAKYWIKTLEWIPYVAPLLLYPWLLRRYGATIGKNVYIATDTRIDAPLTEIGDNTFVGNRAVIANHGNIGRDAFFGRVRIGRNCTIGYLSLIPPNVIIEDKVVVGVYTAVKMHSRLPKDSIWVGIPARQLERKNQDRKIDNEDDNA